MTYEPDRILLSRLLEALGPQVTGGIVVNNGINLPLTDAYLLQIGFSAIHLQSNTGVATALNTGFEWAESQGADFVVTFDQDSEPAYDMVSSLLENYKLLVASGKKVGAVGPQQIDRRTGERTAFIAPISGRRDRVFPAEGTTVEVDHLITSGCMVPLEAWKECGRFLDALFIDYVDIEWCLRLRHGGWHLFGAADAKLQHSIGDDIKKLGGRRVMWHSPLRHYFVFRNGIYLQKLPHIPLMWKYSDGFQLIKKFIFFAVAGHPHSVHIMAMLRGIRDGYRSRLGPAPSDRL